MMLLSARRAAQGALRAAQCAALRTKTTATTLHEKRLLAMSQFAPILGNMPQIAAHLPEVGVSRPNPVQRLAAEPIRAGKDVVLEAPTGYGKTLAYLLPLLSKIDINRRVTQLLVVVPSRELLVQVHSVCSKVVGHGKSNRKGHAIVVKKLGAASPMYSRSVAGVVEAAPHVLISTPKTVSWLLRERQLDMFSVRMAVVDEVDQMLADPSMARYLERVFKPSRRRSDLQFVAASATAPFAALRSAPWLAGRDLRHVTVQANQEERAAIQHRAVLVPSPEAKAAALASVLGAGAGPSKPRRDRSCALVFFDSMRSCLPVRDTLRDLGVRVGVAAGRDLNLAGRRERAAVVRALAAGRLQACLTTDWIMSRGVDLPGLTHVVNFDFPRSAAEYVHRAGRVGRFTDDGTRFSLTRGTVLSLVDAAQAELLRAWAAELGEPLEVVEPPTGGGAGAC